MKRDLNLYNPALEPARELLTVDRFVGVVLLAAALAAGVVAVDEVRARQTEATVAAALQEQAARQAQVEQLAAALAARRPDPQRQRELESLEGVVASRARTVAALDAGALGDTRGMADYFRALARAHQDGVWLREVRVSGTAPDLVVAGQALEAELIPRYLQRLGSQASLRGRSFASIEVSAPSESPAAAVSAPATIAAAGARTGGPVDFRLATAAAQPPVAPVPAIAPGKQP